MSAAGSKVRFSSPRFQQQLGRSRSYRRAPAEPNRARRALGYLLAGLVLAAAGYFTFFENPLTVRGVDVSAGKTASVGAANGSAERYLSTHALQARNLAFVRTGALAKAIERDVPAVASVHVTRRWPNRLNVRLTERRERFALKSTEGVWLVATDGTAVELIPSGTPATATPQLALAPELLGAALPARVGDTVAPGEALGAAEAAIVAVEPAAAGRVTAVRLSSSSESFLLTLSSGYAVVLDRTVDLAVAAENLQELVRQLDPATFATLSYLDLRIPGRAYACPRGSPCAARSPLEPVIPPAPETATTASSSLPVTEPPK